MDNVRSRGSLRETFVDSRKNQPRGMDLSLCQFSAQHPTMRTKIARPICLHWPPDDYPLGAARLGLSERAGGICANRTLGSRLMGPV
jgi:hypothetical protein